MLDSREATAKSTRRKWKEKSDRRAKKKKEGKEARWRAAVQPETF